MYKILRAASLFVSAITYLNANADVMWSGQKDISVTITPFPTTTHSIDINEDGLDDYLISEGISSLSFNPLNINKGLASEDSVVMGQYHYLPLLSGIHVDQDAFSPVTTWQNQQDVLLDWVGTYGDEYDISGSFSNTNGYLAIRFDIAGSIHYGWIHMSHDLNAPPPGQLDLIIHSWAWESEADTPIVTGAIPEPSSGILVVVGALSVWQLRRRRQRRGRSEPLPQCRLSPKALDASDW